MFTFISLTGFFYLVYLYKFDYEKINKMYKFIPYFSNTNNKTSISTVKNNSSNNDTENYNLEIGISDDYVMTDRPPDKNNPVDYYDTSFSTDFVETLPNFHRFYSFTKKNDDHNAQIV